MYNILNDFLAKLEMLYEFQFGLKKTVHILGSFSAYG